MPPEILNSSEAVGINQLWYLIPLIVSVSLVYGATRHELMWPILIHSLRVARWIVVFIAVIFVVLYLVSRSL